MGMKLVGVTKHGQLYLYRKGSSVIAPPVKVTDMAVLVQSGYLYPPRLTFNQALKSDNGWVKPTATDKPLEDIVALVDKVDKAEKRLNLSTMQLEEL